MRLFPTPAPAVPMGFWLESIRLLGSAHHCTCYGMLWIFLRERWKPQQWYSRDFGRAITSFRTVSRHRQPKLPFRIRIKDEFTFIDRVFCFVAAIWNFKYAVSQWDTWNRNSKRLAEPPRLWEFHCEFAVPDSLKKSLAPRSRLTTPHNIATISGTAFSRNFFWDHFSTELCSRTQMWRSRPGFHFTENGGGFVSERRSEICLSRSTFCRGKANE